MQKFRSSDSQLLLLETEPYMQTFSSSDSQRHQSETEPYT